MPESTQATPEDAFFTTAAGDRIHYLDWGGNGRPTHFLHANGFCAGTYMPFVERIRTDLHVTASDIRGHGDSAFADFNRVRHWQIFADDLRQLVSSIMSPPVIGMGHSLGAVATYIAAARWPDLFSHLILIEPVILPRRYLAVMTLLKLIGQSERLPLVQKARRRKQQFESKQAALKRFTAGRGMFKTWSPEFIDAYLECALLEKDDRTAVLKCDPEIEAQIYASVPTDVWSYAPRIGCPTLAIRGEHSDTFFEDAARRLAVKIPDCQMITLSGTGHFVPMEKPDTLAAIIRDFLLS